MRLIRPPLHRTCLQVDLQFAEDDAVEREDEVLTEMRLSVPLAHKLADADAAAKAARDRVLDKLSRLKASGDVVDEGETAEAVRDATSDPAVMLHALVSSALGSGGAVGDALAGELPPCSAVHQQPHPPPVPSRHARTHASLHSPPRRRVQRWTRAWGSSWCRVAGTPSSSSPPFSAWWAAATS